MTIIYTNICTLLCIFICIWGIRLLYSLEFVTVEIWYDLTVVEFYIYIALLYYIAIVELPILEHYWSAQYFLFQWNWARAFMSKNMIRQIGSFMKTSIIKLKIHMNMCCSSMVLVTMLVHIFIICAFKLYLIWFSIQLLELCTYTLPIICYIIDNFIFFKFFCWILLIFLGKVFSLKYWYFSS